MPIELRNTPQACWQPSVRYGFANLAEIIADSPLVGDLYLLNDCVYRWNGSDIVPITCTGCTAIPGAAFAVSDQPTTNEAQVWVQANVDPIIPGSVYYYSTSPDADYVWTACDSTGILLRVESPRQRIDALIGIVDNNPLNFITDASNSFTTCPGGTIVSHQWVLTHGGVEVANITGAPGADASGESDVDSGTYTTPKWDDDIFVGSCGDLLIQLSSTDSCGLVDTTTLTIPDFGFVELVFLNDGSGGINGIFEVVLNINSGIADWDMGDGTIYEGVNNPSHTYALTGNYVAVAKVCPKDLLGITVLQEEGLNGTFDSIFERADLCRFTEITSLRIVDNANFSGELPSSLACWSSLTTLIITNTLVSGSVPQLSSSILQVDLQNNNLDGIIPSMNSYTSITTFRVDDNQLIGTIPSLTNATSLQYFTADNNLLTGAVPNLTTNTALLWFFVENNLLTGNIHTDLTPNTVLEKYNVSDNQLTGAVLPDITNLTALDLYHIDRNLIAAVTAGTYFSTNTSLVNIDISNNQLSGTIPDTSAAGANLQVYFLGTNQYTATLPSMTANSGLTQIAFGANTDITYVDGTFSALNSVLVSVTATSNGLSATEVDDLICDVNDAVSSNGTLNWSGNSGRTAASDGCYTALDGRGWTLIG